MPATDSQVQHFVDERIRPWCESFRALLSQANDIKASIGDVYAALTQTNPTWTDQNNGNPPHLLVPSDVLADNTIINDFITFANANAQLPILLESCVREIGS